MYKQAGPIVKMALNIKLRTWTLVLKVKNYLQDTELMSYGGLEREL